MLGAGTVINPIVKIVTTVAILAAVYFFIVKPTLDTTEDITDNVNQSINESFNSSNDQIDKALRQAERISETAGADVAVSDADTSIKQANRLLDCIQDAAGDVEAMQRCSQ